MTKVDRLFGHVLSVPQLAKQVKRVANRSKRHNYEHKIDNLMKELNKAIEDHDSDDVKKVLKKIIPFFDKEDKWLELILEDELILLNEEEIIEHKENQIRHILQKVVGKLTDEEKEKIKDINSELGKFEINMVKDTEIIRSIIEDIIKGEFVNAQLKLTKLFNFGTEKMKERSIAHGANKEAKDIGKEKNIKESQSLVNELWKQVNNEKGDNKKLIDKLSKSQHIIISALEDELKRAYKIILQDFSLYIHLLKIYQELSNDNKELKDSGFSPKFMEKVVTPWNNKENEHFKNFFNLLNIQGIDLERKAQAEKAA